MATTVTYNKRQMHRILKNNGWELHHITGGHHIYKNAKGEHLTLSISKSNKMYMQKIIKEYNLKL